MMTPQRCWRFTIASALLIAAIHAGVLASISAQAGAALVAAADPVGHLAKIGAGVAHTFLYQVPTN